MQPRTQPRQHDHVRDLRSLMDQKRIDDLNAKAKGLTASDIIKLAAAEFASRITFASSLGEEDQVITDIIASVAPTVGIFTLDTGRLYQESYDLLAKTQKKYHNL